MNQVIVDVLKTMTRNNIERLCAAGYQNELGLLIVVYAETLSDARADLLKQMPTLKAPNGMASWSYFELDNSDDKKQLV